MKKQIGIGAIVFVLGVFLAACPETADNSEPIDQRLAREGGWTNNQTGDDEKSFVIQSGGSFECSIDPGLGRAAVTGKLTRENGIYVMSGLTVKNTDGGLTTAMVSAFNNHAISITFNSDGSFDFSSAESGPSATAVNDYFGGTYYPK
jgi:hypothetical protein